MELFPLQPYSHKKVCVALSGGADSVCLLHYFYQNRAQYHITLSALTCEHGIRGEASLRDLQFVKDLCSEYQIPLSVFQADIPARAKKSGRGLEEEGRIFRYECFSQIIQDGKADLVVTAHHRDDFAETVLFRLIRGTSLSGLAAFSKKVARPLLLVPRATILEYINSNALPYVTDESNSDNRYTRNLLRNRALPVLEEAVNGAGDHLVKFALRAQKDDEFLYQLAAEALMKSEDEISLPVNLPIPIFSRAVLCAMQALGIKKDYTEKNIEEISKLNQLQNGKKVCLPNGAEVVREHDKLIFYRPCSSQLKIPFTFGTFPWGEYHITVSESKTQPSLCFDLDALPDGCEIRTRQDGDKITPYKNSEKPLKKFLTDKKISARKGRALAMLAKGNEVYAVFGVEISDKIKVTEKTVRIGYLSTEKI